MKNALLESFPPLGFRNVPFPGFDELRRRAERSGKELINIAEQRDLNQIFYLDGGTYEAPAIVVVIQAVKHATDHRSQVAPLLSQQEAHRLNPMAGRIMMR